MKRTRTKSNKKTASAGKVSPEPKTVKPHGQDGRGTLTIENAIVAGLLAEAQSLDNAAKEKLEAIAENVRLKLKATLVREWPGLFKLFKDADGTYRAEFSPELEARRVNLLAGFKPTEGAVDEVAAAIKVILFASYSPAIPPLAPSDLPDPSMGRTGSVDSLEGYRTAHSIYESSVAARIVFDQLQRTIAPRLRFLAEANSQEKLILAKQLKKDFGKALDGIVGEGPFPAGHKNKRLTRIGNKAEVSTAVHTMDAARTFVQSTQRLPTKSELREQIRTQYTKLTIKDRNWPIVLRECGLQLLPKKIPYAE